jgi:membrane fusion protein (multidrug efflux system)
MRTSLLLSLLPVLLVGCGKKNAAQAPPPQGAPEVSVVTIETQHASLTTEVPGRVAASQVAEVRPQVGGIIQNRLFVEGTDVKAGEALYQIDPASYQAMFDGAKAALARAEANVIPLKLKADRYKGLVSSEAVSQQDYDDAAAALKLAQAELESAKAALDTAKINLAYTKVTAPISGRIGRSSVTNGALVTASQAAPLATIQQLDPVYVDVTQSSTEMLRLRQALESGQLRSTDHQASVKLTLDDNSAYPESGVLKFSEAFVEPNTGSVTLRTLFPNPKLTLLPGMFVRAFLQEGEKEDAILVPQRCVTRNPAGNPVVTVIGAEDKAEPRVIQTNRTVGDNWLVTDGLHPGDRVVVEGLLKARPGTVVKAVPFVTKQAEAAASAPPQSSATSKN